MFRSNNMASFHVVFSYYGVILNIAVALVLGETFVVSSLTNEDVQNVNRVFASTNVKNRIQCATKCLHVGCTSLTYGEKLGSTHCYPSTAHEYSGRQALTSSGEICQRWDANEPSKNIFMDASSFPDVTLSDAATFCRYSKDIDVGNRIQGPWCNTMNPDTRWQYCPVDRCGVEFRHNRCYHDSLTAKDYIGTWSRTRSGKLCQRWDTQSPHVHSYTSASGFPDSSISAAENYCRDPGGLGYTWCYTMEPGTIWEACDVTSCTKYINDKRCYDTESHFHYKGEWDVAIGNYMCQRWDSQTPNTHTFTSADFPNETLEDAGNYCRDPDGEGHLWCYVANISIRWLFCHVEPCPPDHVTCYDGPSVRSYMGTWSKTKSGKVCQRWDSQQPHPHNLTSDLFEEDSLTDAKNFCRDPTGSGELWCYTTDPKVPKEDCGIGNCNGENTCQVYIDAKLYNGPKRSEYYTKEP